MQPPPRPPLIVICGPTAVGKTELALKLAQTFPLEIVSADSRQVYCGLDIGTAKPTREELAQVAHHLIDVVPPDGEFTASDFSRLGRQAVSAIAARERLPLVVGGTGLYLRCLTGGMADVPAGSQSVRRDLLQIEMEGGEGSLYRCLQVIDPPLAARLSPRDLVRIVRALEVHRLTGRRLSEIQAGHAFADRPFRLLQIGLGMERDDLYERIDRRTEAMVAAGLREEVEALLEKGYSPGLKSLQTIGYREMIRHVRESIGLPETIAAIQRETRRYAKRQLTWFRKDDEIIWVDSSREFDRILALIDDFMRDQRSGHG